MKDREGQRWRGDCRQSVACREPVSDVTGGLDRAAVFVG